jgi:hypothetical protein
VRSSRRSFLENDTRLGSGKTGLAFLGDFIDSGSNLTGIIFAVGIHPNGRFVGG